MAESRNGFWEVTSMVINILGAIPFAPLGFLGAQDEEARFRWLLLGSCVSAILLGFYALMRYLRSKEDAEKIAVSEGRAQEIMDKAKGLMRGVGMRVCGEAVLCRDETHDPSLVRIALELGADEKLRKDPIEGVGRP